jgi:hypothetical protein
MTAPKDPVVIAFPGPRKPVAPRNLGLTPLSQSLGPVATSPKGHWCDRCKGIWYSHFGEGRCPVCGGRT